MFQFLYFFIFFSQSLTCSSNTNNAKKIVQVKPAESSSRFKGQDSLLSYLVSNKSNTKITYQKLSNQNDDDYNNDGCSNENPFPFEKEENLNDFLNDGEETESQDPENFLKKKKCFKLNFSNRDLPERKINSQGLKEISSKKELDLKMLSVLTVQTELLTESGQISNTHDSDSESASTFNSYKSDKNDSSQQAKK